MIKNLKLKILNSPEWLISICVFFVFWLVNKSFTGPTLLTDEVGYLANAALISGHIIDGANSWHAGYSFFLAPLFKLFSDPYHIWHAIMVLNALLWTLSFLMLAKILKVLAPIQSKWQFFLALLISAAYPTWITVAGYAFVTSAFVFIYLLSIIALLKWKPDKYWSIIPHAILIGYLYWIHPVGLAVSAASIMVIGFTSLRMKKYGSAFINFIFIAALIIVYREVIEKWLIMLATPEGYNPLSQHYPDSERIINRFLSNDFWISFAATIPGQLSYLIVSSLGLTLLGLSISFNKSIKLAKGFIKNKLDNTELLGMSTYPFLIISLLGVLLMGAVLFSGSPNRIDHWIYGRYTDMVVLPLLALGCFSSWNKKGLFSTAAIVILTGLILNQVANLETVNHITHTVAFWPQYLNIMETNYLHWMIAGGTALVLVGRVRDDSWLGNVLGVVFILICFAISAFVSNANHHYNLAYGSKPSYFVDIIRDNYPPGTCIGFNPEGTDFMHVFQVQRYHLHLFYLYDYDYRRMLPQEWLKDCYGPYFTYRIDSLYEKDGVRVIGKERLSNLYLLTRGNIQPIALPEEPELDYDIYFANGWIIDDTVILEGVKLATYLGQVGYYEDGSIYSSEKEGFLLIGPETKIGPGEYNLTVFGVSLTAENSWVDIVSNRGEIRHTKLFLNDKTGSKENVIINATFKINSPIHDLTVRLYTSPLAEIRIDGYTIN